MKSFQREREFGIYLFIVSTHLETSHFICVILQLEKYLWAFSMIFIDHALKMMIVLKDYNS